MRAYIRAVRFYNGALKNGRLDGANADDVIAILSEATPIKSRDIYKAWALPALDPHALQLRKLMETVVLARSASMRDRIAMYNANALKIGIFGANCSSGRSATKVPERWSASWPDCRRLARMADEAGIDFMLP